MRLLLALLCLFTLGCNDNARVGTRNIAEMGAYLSTSIDPATAAIGEVIKLEATAIADNYDAMLFGLWNSKSHPSITEDALRADLQAALDANLKLTQDIADETAAKVAVGTWVKVLFGLLLTTAGGGAGYAGVTMLRNRTLVSKLKTAITTLVEFGVDMTRAETDTQAEDVKKRHQARQINLGVHDLIKPELEKAKKPATVGSHA